MTGSLLGVAVLLAQPAAPLTLEQAVGKALAQNPSIADLDAQRVSATANASATRANYGPKLRVEGNVIVWDEEQVLALGGGGGSGAPLPAPATPYEELLAGLAQSLGTPTTVRDQVTASATVQIVQPLTGLYAVRQGTHLAEIGVDVAGIALEGGRRRVELNAVEAYFRVLQAQALETAVQKSVESLEGQAKRAEALEASGLLGRNDVLRLQLALSAARQRVLEVQGQVAQAQAGLAVTLGEPAGARYAVDNTLPAFADEPAPPLEATRAAVGERREIAEVQARVRQAEQGVTTTQAKLLPDLNLIGQYQHTEGSSLQDPDSLFAGLFLTWTAFEWGATSKQVDVAESQVLRARALETQLSAGLTFEAEQAWINYQTASSGLAVAQQAVEQGEEALRLERARFEVQQSTSTELVDAEAALTQARVTLENARYNRVIARARLRYATGRTIVARAGENP